jgi:CheY-like chemotaxis protein
VALRAGDLEVDLAPGLEILRDPPGSLSRDAAAALPFGAPPGDADLGLVRGAVWLRVALENASGEPGIWAVTLDAPGLDRIDAWEDRGGAAVHRRGGLAIPAPEREVAARGPWHEVPLALHPGERATLVVRLASSGPLSVAATARRPGAAAARLSAAMAWSGAAAGALAALALLALVAALAIRDRTAAGFGALALALAGSVVAGSGVGAALLWPDAPRWAAAASPALAASAAGVGVVFAARFLGLPLRGAPAAVAALAPVAAAVALVHPAAGRVAAGVLVVAGSGVALGWVGRAIRRRARGAVPLAIATVPLAVVAAADTLAAAGLLPARPPGSPALAATACFAAAVLGPSLAGRIRAGDASARAALQRAAEARTAELAIAIEALRREGDARRRAEEAHRRAQEDRRRAEEDRLGADEARLRAEEALRRAAAGAPAPPRVVEAPPPAVLLVDEDEPVREACARVLERLGYRVIAAEDGREALRAAEAASGVDVVVADVSQRGMGGKELADRLSARWPSVRVLLTAGSAHDVLGPSPGGFAFLPKPFSPGALAAKVRELLQGAAARRSA